MSDEKINPVATVARTCEYVGTCIDTVALGDLTGLCCTTQDSKAKPVIAGTGLQGTTSFSIEKNIVTYN